MAIDNNGTNKELQKNNIHVKFKLSAQKDLGSIVQVLQA
jgi:hypothetical protein